MASKFEQPRTAIRQRRRNALLAVLFAAGAFMLSACEYYVRTDDDNIGEFSTKQLCSFLGPRWKTTREEEDVIYRELERRGVRCYAGHVASPPRARTDPESQNEEEAGPSSGFGSGVVINADGYILTNEHVIDGCTKLDVVHNNERLRATVRAKDAANDVAVVKINISTPDFARLRTSPGVRLAESVMVLGFPLRWVLADQMNATSGDVTALAGLRGDSRFLQISAPVQPGNSGGPVFDQSGLVVGIATAKLDTIALAGLTGDIAQNINFALKVSTVRTLLDSYGITYFTAAKSENLSKPELAAKSKPAVVLILCNDY